MTNRERAMNILHYKDADRLPAVHFGYWGELLVEWANEFDADFAKKLQGNKEFAIAILSIGRGGKKPRKDFATWAEVKDYMGFFYDEYLEKPVFDEKFSGSMKLYNQRQLPVGCFRRIRDKWECPVTFPVFGSNHKKTSFQLGKNSIPYFAPSERN